MHVSAGSVSNSNSSHTISPDHFRPQQGMRTMRILVVEDEKKVSSFIQKGLTEESYAVDVAHDGEEGLGFALQQEYDLIILDIMLPKMDGLKVLEQIRAKGRQVPVLLLTARDTLEDKVKGLDTGADDYLPKPFAFTELLARVRALLRRSSNSRAAVLKVDTLSLDPVSREVRRSGRKIDLTAKEYALLEFFMRNCGKILTRTVISEHVWDMNFDSSTNIVDVYVNHLRNKVEAPTEKKLIHTVRGVGYVLKEADAA